METLTDLLDKVVEISEQQDAMVGQGVADEVNFVVAVGKLSILTFCATWGIPTYLAMTKIVDFSSVSHILFMIGYYAGQNNIPIEDLEDGTELWEGLNV